MKNIIVYGSRFGQFYLEALKRMKGIKIVGLLAKGSDRSYECARYYNIPLYTSLDEVLNNAKNIEVTLKNIKKVLKKDGKVIIVEAIGESVQMLISQAFMMQEPDDARAEKNETFLKLYQWHELFQKVGFAVEKSLPTIDSELCVYNQKVFVLSCQLEDKYSGSK